jgi:hypothetical protein
MGPNYIKHEKQYSIGVDHEGPTLEEIKEQRVNLLLEMQPILARFVADHLIEYDENTKLKWKVELIKQLDISELIMLRGILENKKEIEQRTY